MDWKQFFASMVGSLAWPVVVVALLVLLRKHLASMAERLEELTLPGGARTLAVEFCCDAQHGIPYRNAVRV
jgi:hypothetical protein